MDNLLSLEEQCFIPLNAIEIKSAEEVYNLFKESMTNLKKEFFVVLFLNTKNCLIKGQIISIGTLNTSLVHPREVFRTAIVEGANSIILVHNHPDGDPTPSDNDIKITKRIAKSADILGIKVLDHIIIAKNDYDNIPIKYT